MRRKDLFLIVPIISGSAIFGGFIVWGGLVKGWFTQPCAFALPSSQSKAEWVGGTWAPWDSILPSGIIVMWSGDSTSIPDGWALCDGGTYKTKDGKSVTTPNLKDKFIYGCTYTSSQDSTGVTGGQNSYTLTVAQLPSHTHTFTTDPAGNHTHQVHNKQPAGRQ